MFSLYTSLETFDPLGGASLPPGNLFDKCCIKNHLTLLRTKYIRCGPHFVEENISPIIGHWKVLMPVAEPG